MYAGHRPSAVVTHCVWKRQHREGLTLPSPAETCPGAVGMGLVGLCMCVSMDLGSVSRSMNLACVGTWACYYGRAFECSMREYVNVCKLYVDAHVCPYGGRRAEAEVSGCQVWMGWGEEGLTPDPAGFDRHLLGEPPFFVSRGSCRVTRVFEGLVRHTNPAWSGGGRWAAGQAGRR